MKEKFKSQKNKICCKFIAYYYLFALQEPNPTHCKYNNQR